MSNHDVSVQPLAKFYVEGFFVFFWLGLNAMAVSLLDSTDWWIGFQFFYLGTATNLVFYAMIHYLRLIQGRDVISWRILRIFMLNAGIAIIMSAQAYAHLTAKRNNFSLTISSMEQPSFTTWYRFIMHLDDQAITFVYLQTFGMLLCITVALWLLLDFMRSLVKDWSIVSFPMTAYASMYGLSCMAGSLIFDGIQGGLILLGYNIALYRGINMVFMVGWLIAPFITVCLTLAPALYADSHNSQVSIISRQWVPLFLWGTTLYLVAQTAWHFVVPAHVPFLVSLGTIGFPSIIVAITLTNLSRPVLASVGIGQLTLVNGLVWLSVAELTIGVWKIFIDTTVFTATDNRITFILMMTGLQTGVMALLLYLVQAIRQIGIPKDKRLALAQLAIYTICTRIIQLDGLQWIAFPVNTTMVCIVTMGVVIIVPAMMGYPRTLPGELNERHKIWLLVSEQKEVMRQMSARGAPMRDETEAFDRLAHRRQQTKQIYFDVDLVS